MAEVKSDKGNNINPPRDFRDSSVLVGHSVTSLFLRDRIPLCTGYNDGTPIQITCRLFNLHLLVLLLFAVTTHAVEWMLPDGTVPCDHFRASHLRGRAHRRSRRFSSHGHEDYMASYHIVVCSWMTYGIGLEKDTAIPVTGCRGSHIFYTVGS
jgi:hypothetical protein